MHTTRIPADPGLQPERTALSWVRTASGLLLNAVLNLRSAYVYESHPLLALSLALLGASAAAFVFGRSRHRQLLTAQRAGMEVPHLATLGMFVSALTACVAGILSVALNYTHCPTFISIHLVSLASDFIPGCELARSHKASR